MTQKLVHRGRIHSPPNAAHLEGVDQFGEIWNSFRWGSSFRDQPRSGDVIQPKPQPIRPFTPRLRLVPGAQRPGGAQDATFRGEDLVGALRAGNPEAPAALWARYSPSVGRVLAKALGPSLEIEDLTQEVFLRVFGRLPSLRDPSALRAFVLAVAMNVLKWELRRRWVGRRVRLSVAGRCRTSRSRQRMPKLATPCGAATASSTLPSRPRKGWRSCSGTWRG